MCYHLAEESLEVVINNKRRTERETTTQGAIKTVTQLADGSSLPGAVGDLSHEGVKIIGDANGLKVGDEIVLGIQFPLGHDANYRCVVRHIDSDSYGVEIVQRIDSESA